MEVEAESIVKSAIPKLKRPSMYKVLMLNDDYTPMDFVVHILQKYFNKSQDEAQKIMTSVHQTGKAICGVFTFEIAETKVAQVLDSAKQNEYPLHCIMEKE